MTAPGIEVRGLGLRFGSRQIFDNLTFTIPGGQWISLLGGQRCRKDQPAAYYRRAGKRPPLVRFAPATGSQ